MKKLVLLIFSLVSVANIFAQTAYPTNSFLIHGAWVNESIRISYTSSPSNPILERRIANTQDPFVQIATLSSAGGEFFDTNSVAGVLYEYLTPNATTRRFQCGGKLPLVEQRGWYVILLDNDIAEGISTEFRKFKQNLYTDGYRVKTILISRSQTPDEVRALLQQLNNELTGGIKQVLLLGHIPVPYSGTEGHDIHVDHHGAWATDTYYADLDGEWLDLVTVDYSARDANKNFPGDRKFDHDFMPSAAELEVGRVDMFDMPAFGMTETALVNRYLAKNNLFKSGNLTIMGRGLETVGSIYGFSEVMGATVTPCVGINNLFVGNYTTLTTQPKLFSFGYGASNYTICGGVVSTSDFVSSNWLTVFTGLLGSYLWDFDNTNSVMRASLFSSGILLNCSFSTDYWGLMNIGKSIGEVNKINQTNERLTASNLHGDPSVRINYPIMPSNLILSPNADTTQINLSWTASTEADEPLLGYHIYRSSSFDSIPTRLNQQPVDGTTFIDENPLPGKNYYIVKLISLRGTFYNSSIGLIDSLVVPDAQPNNWEITFNLNQSYCLDDSIADIYIEATSGNILNNLIRLDISNNDGSFITTSYSQIINIIDNKIGFNMPELPLKNHAYSIKISDLNNQFPEIESANFIYNSIPEINLNYTLNYDTLSYQITGDTEYLTSIETNFDSSILPSDSIYIYGETGEFIFTTNSQNICGAFQTNDTINSILNTGNTTGLCCDFDISPSVFYPNPVLDYLYIANSTEKSWEVYDITGKLIDVACENYDNKLRFNFSKIKPGIYYIRATNTKVLGYTLIKQ